VTADAAVSAQSPHAPVAALRGPGGRVNPALLKPFSPALFGAQTAAP
jgi:hypothetical protein